MKRKIITMLEMQNAMNEKVHSDWRGMRFEWYRAIWIEAAELLDHYGWKWWKKQEPDRDQVVLELIDIWHFGLSILLTDNEDPEKIVELIETNLNIPRACEDFRQSLEAFALQTLSSKKFDLCGFGSLMAGVELEFDDLYRSYVGKNVLNFFRQDHGYQNGSYVKIWGDKEDNEHLVELIDDISAGVNDFRDVLYKRLQERYTSLTQ